LTFSQALIPFEERIQSLEVLGKMFMLDCTITDLIEESNKRLRIFKENESCATDLTAEQRVERAA